jgi:hypothetical protein
LNDGRWTGSLREFVLLVEDPAMNRRACRSGRHATTEKRPSLSDITVARYVDREIEDARAIANLCATVAAMAARDGRALVAEALRDLQVEFNDEASSLTPMTVPGVRWPRREAPECDDDVDVALVIVEAALTHAERVLQWISKRPDLPPSAMTMFRSMAGARRTQRQHLAACRELESHAPPVAA